MVETAQADLKLPQTRILVASLASGEGEVPVCLSGKRGRDARVVGVPREDH